MGDACINPGMRGFVKHLKEGLNTYVKCVEIGNGMFTSLM